MERPYAISMLSFRGAKLINDKVLRIKFTSSPPPPASKSSFQGIKILSANNCFKLGITFLCYAMKLSDHLVFVLPFTLRQISSGEKFLISSSVANRSISRFRCSTARSRTDDQLFPLLTAGGDERRPQRYTIFNFIKYSRKLNIFGLLFAFNLTL